MIGRAGKTYNPLTRTQFGRIRANVYQCFTRDNGRWSCFNADYYKEMAQTSWLTPEVEAGSSTAYEGLPREYANQTCREVLEAKGEVGGRGGTVLVYRWNTLPGKHDYLDCHAMAYAAAGWEGLLSADAGTPGSFGPSRHAASRNRRKVYGE